ALNGHFYTLKETYRRILLVHHVLGIDSASNRNKGVTGILVVSPWPSLSSLQ
ncbi:hypothetical protein L9F63_014604, partial [Diploptera punctata]